MTTVARPAPQRPLRNTPTALLYVGLPAYLGVVGFEVRDLLDSHASLAAGAGIAGMVVFTAAFFWLTFAFIPHSTQRTRAVLIVLMGVIAVGLALLGLTTAVFGAAVAAMAGESLPPRQSIPVILGESALVTASALANDFDGPEILSQAIIVLVVGLFTFGVRRLAEANRELMEAREEVARLAVLDERVRFARDLHDLLGHSLTVIRAKSELASRLAPVDVTKAVQEMNEVERVAREALAEVRETVTGYRRPSVATEITNARTALDAAHIAADVHVDVIDVPPAIDETLAWVLREMVTNVVRHSGAASCRIDVSADEGAFVLAVTDDGRGANGAMGNGLDGARERLALVNGTLDVDSDGGPGFRARASVPRTR
jgi:two-component system sensor histidine kinase DesK